LRAIQFSMLGRAMKQGRKFTVVVEGDVEGYYVATHPAVLPHSGRKLRTLGCADDAVREAIEVRLGSMVIEAAG
jgi:hypothetical protein